MKKNSRSLLILLLFVLGFVILTVFSVLSQKTKMNPEGTVGNTAGNLNNLGLFCEHNGLVYFSNPYDGGALYSMTPEETKFKKLGSVPVELINAGGKYLYYFQTSAGGSAGLGYVRTRSGIYRSNLQGKKTISLNSGTAYYMQLVNNYLYYTLTDKKGAHFYKQKIDKSAPQLLFDFAVNPACASGNTIYYNGTEDDHALYAFDTAADTSVLVWGGNLWNPVAHGDYIYYMDVSSNYRLCRYSLLSGTAEVLTNDRIDTYNLTDSHIYYQKSSTKSPCLIRMGLDGSNPELVAEGIYSDINVTSRYVYFHPFGSTAPTYRTPADGPVQVTSFDTALEAALKNNK